MKETIHIIVIHILSLQICLGNTLRSDIIEYNLNNDMIEEIYISDLEKEIFSLVIELNEISANEFANLTKNNIGNYLIIKFGDIILVEAIIQGEIGSGVIVVGQWNNYHEPKKLLDVILDK